MFNKLFVDALESYKINPCLKNAIAFLEIAPMLGLGFQQCDCVEFYKTMQSFAVHNLELSILEAADYCAADFKNELDQNFLDDKQRSEKYVYIYYEFLSFFSHLTNRLMSAIVGNDTLTRFNNVFGSYIVYGSVELIIGHWPQESKNKIIDEVFEQLNESEGKYSESKDVIWDTDEVLDGITGNSVLSKLTRTIAMQCGYEMVDYQGIPVTKNPIDILVVFKKVTELFINVMKNMKFESLVKDVAKTI